MDIRVKKILKKYFYFLRTPLLVTKKFTKKLKKLLSKYFNLSDIYYNAKDAKDYTLDELNIERLLDAIDAEADELDGWAAVYQGDIDLLEDTGASFTDMLDAIILDQNNYNWMEG